MIAGIARIIAFAVVLGGLAGCGSAPYVVGSWSGDRKLPGKDAPPVASALGRVKLALGNDYRFALSDGGLPMAGTYTVKEKEVMLTVEAVGGNPPVQGFQAPRITILGPNELLYENPDGILPEPVSLKRAATPPANPS